MTHKYCQTCGTKHVISAKFCSSCGNSFSGATKPTTVAQRHPRQDEDGDGDVSFVPSISKLEYEIVNDGNTKLTVNDVINRPPIDPSLRREPEKAVNLTMEQYLSESLKACAPARTPKDIDES